MIRGAKALLHDSWNGYTTTPRVRIVLPSCFRRERLRELVEEAIGAIFSHSYKVTSTLAQEMIEEKGHTILSETVEELTVLSDAIFGNGVHIKDLTTIRLTLRAMPVASMFVISTNLLSVGRAKLGVTYN